jgi:hypothetical protein
VFGIRGVTGATAVSIAVNMIEIGAATHSQRV